MPWTTVAKGLMEDALWHPLPRKPEFPILYPEGQVSALLRWVRRWGWNYSPVGLEPAAWEQESASNHIVTAAPKGCVPGAGPSTWNAQCLTKSSPR